MIKEACFLAFCGFTITLMFALMIPSFIIGMVVYSLKLGYEGAEQYMEWLYFRANTMNKKEEKKDD